MMLQNNVIEIISLQTASIIFSVKWWAGKFWLPAVYAHIIINSQDMGITGADGTVTVPNLPPNTTIDFTVTKEGYVTGFGTVITGDAGTVTNADPIYIVPVATPAEAYIILGLIIGLGIPTIWAYLKLRKI